MGSSFAMKHRRNPMVLALLSTSEMPSVASIRDQASKTGRLKKLSGKGILTSGTWREKFCMLVGNKLYYFDSEESSGAEKSCGFVNLEYFDSCSEASTRMARKATNVFVIGSSDKGFFEAHTGRHYFAAETLPEMKEWVNAINSAMKNRSRKDKRVLRDGSLTPGQSKRESKTQSKDDPAGDSLPRSSVQLDHVTKGRVRGPQGRRLPRKPQRPSGGNDSKADSVLDLNEETGVRDSRGRATSLSALEASSDTHPKTSDFNDDWDEPENRDLDGAETPDIELIYDYSSSDSESPSIQLNGQKPSGIFRRPLSRAGNHNIRNSSVTPPPCILRKNRRDQENNGDGVKGNGAREPALPVDTHEPAHEYGTLQRASSGSSLSTLTPDTYSNIPHNGGPYLSLQRNKRKQGEQWAGNAITNGAAHHQSPTLHNMKLPFAHQRQASSAQGSPLLNAGLHHHSIFQHNFGIQRNGYGSHNGSPSNTFDRKAKSNCGNAGNLLGGFQREIETLTREMKQLDSGMDSLRQDVGTLQENLVTVKGAVETAKDKMNRIQDHVNYVEKQVASMFQEATAMKQQALELLESAESAKNIQTGLMEEAQTLVTFLRQSTNNCVSPASYVHQHFNGHFAQSSCCSPSPVPSCGPHPLPQSSPLAQQVVLRRRGKTPERSIGSEENGLENGDNKDVNGFLSDTIKSRNLKSAMSNYSSGSTGSNGSHSGCTSNRVSVADPFDRKIAPARASNGKSGDCMKISHL